MPYIGSSIATNFASTIRDNFTGDGSTTSFTLSRNAASENDLEVFVGNVRQQPGSAYTVSTNTLAFTGTPANGEVIYVVHQAGALQTVRAGTDFGARDLQFSGDGQKIKFGIDSEVELTHVHNSGFAIKRTTTTDDSPVTLVLQTGETDIAASDKLGVINFQAPDEGTGTDAILVAAGIEAVSEGDFSASSNATKLSFLTGSSGTATEKMSISSGGNVAVTGNMTVGGDLDVTGTVSFSENNVTDVGILSLDTLRGDADTNTSITFSGSGVITVATDGSTSFTANADQTVTFSAGITATTGTFSGVVDADAGITVDNITIDGTEIDLSSGDLTVDVAGNIILDAGGAEITFNDDGTSIGHISMVSSNLTLKSLVSDADIFLQGNDGGTGITALRLDMSEAGAATFNSTIQGTTITATTAFVPDASDGAALGTSSLEFSDLFLADGAVINFGADQDINITHVADTGLTTNADFTVGDDLFVQGGLIDLKNDGSFVSQIKFYCESSNAHAQTLIGAPHSESASNTLTLPSSGGNARLVSTSSTATLTNKTLTSPVINTATVGTSIVPASADGASLGSTSAEFSDLYLADSGTIKFGNDQDVEIQHEPDVGLTLVHNGTGDNLPMILRLKSEEDAITANEVIASIEMAAGDSDGVDGATVAAGIHAIAEGTFSASANATKLVFTTGVSETAAASATAKMTLSSAGVLTTASNIVSGGTITGGGLLTTGGNIVIPDAGNIGSASDTDAIAIASNGAVTLTQALSGTSADFDGGVTIDNITIDGTEIDLSSGDLTLDVAGDIILDADGGDVSFRDGGTGFLAITNSSSDAVIHSVQNDKDMIFTGTDGGSTTTALTFDMSDAGTAIFGHDLKVADNNNMQFGAGADLMLSSDGTNGTIATLNGYLQLDSADDILLDADGGDIFFRDGGTTFGRASKISSDFAMMVGVSDADMVFYMNPSGSSSERFRIRSTGFVRQSANLSVSSHSRLGTSTANVFHSDTTGSIMFFLENTSADPFGLMIDYSQASADDNTNHFIKLEDSSAERCIIFSDGDVKNHDNSYGSLSDERIKDNITDANSQWDDIKALKVRNFQLKDDIRQYGADKAKSMIGVIAQEVETAGMNGLVKHADPNKGNVLSDSAFGTVYVDGDDIPDGKAVGDVKEIKEKVKGISYSVLYMKAIKALQEAMTRIETLEASNTALAARIKTLEDA